MQPIVRAKRDSRRGRVLSGAGTDRARATKTRAGFPVVPLIFKVLAIPRRRGVRSRGPDSLAALVLDFPSSRSKFRPVRVRRGASG